MGPLARLTAPRRVLIAGLPRSGTTWIARMLASSDGASLVFEPDNHQMFPFALKAKRPLPGGYYPLPSAGADTCAYERLWRSAFGAEGHGYTTAERARRLAARRLLHRRRHEQVRRAFIAGGGGRIRVAEALAVPERPPRDGDVVVKSVYLPLALEWVVERVRPTDVVIVFRDLRNVVSSWLELGWIDSREDELAASDPLVLERVRLELGAPPLAPSGSPLSRVTWLLALFALALHAAARRNPGWHVVRHEQLIARLPESMRALADALGLRWGEAAECALAAGEQPGRGFEIARTPAMLGDVWRRRLTPEQITDIDAALRAFPGACVLRAGD